MILAFNIILIVISIIILIWFLENDLGLFLLSLMILIQYLWMFLSISVIENGVFINEQGRNGYFAFSGLILLLFYISTLLSLLFYKSFFKVIFKEIPSIKFKINPFNDGNLTVFFLGVIIFLAYFNLLNSPIPLISEKVTKFNFWDHAKYPFLRPLIGNVMAFVGFGSVLLYRVNKKISMLYVFLYILYLILIGQKFTGFLIGIYGGLIALYFSSKIKIKFQLKWFLNKYFLTVFISLFILVYYKYTIDNPFKYMGLTPIESVFYRAFGLQAHVFWGVVEKYVYNGTDNTWNISELWNGMHILMREFWPWSYEGYISVTSRGVSWTNAYPSILLRIFPLPIALFVNLLLLSIVGCFQSLLTKFIERKSYLLSIVFFQLLMWVSYTFTMSYFKKTIIPFILLFTFLVFVNFIKKIQK